MKLDVYAGAWACTLVKIISHGVYLYHPSYLYEQKLLCYLYLNLLDLLFIKPSMELMSK